MFKLLPAYLLISALIFSHCRLDDPQIPNEEELITTLRYTLTPVNGGNSAVFTFQDYDGEGGEDPLISGGVLTANTEYTGSLEILNEISFPLVDIGQEIQTEDTEHQFFLATSGGLLANVEYADTDSNGHPVGLITKLITRSVSSGNLTITLRHEPDKTAPGVSKGDLSQAGGETDLEIVFDVQIQ
ncbi:MAG TPA: type 1 periplasmic binding fold superfamily protein [Saprospiraceae bacterium]|nr:type 1 periplasmic binding fold superfamily protein [Saprospiraceae bacterium]HNT19048.1 type 1 periplasmic binding fold superfamily protein [Saprospiraceae bacterium]